MVMRMTCSARKVHPHRRYSGRQRSITLPKTGAKVRKINPDLQFPTEKDSEVLDRGEGWVVAHCAEPNQWVCEQKVVILDKNPPEGAEILGPVVGTTTNALDDNSKITKRCSLCDNRQLLLETKGT